MLPLQASLTSEWRKVQGSFAMWFVVAGAAFVPTVLLIARIWRHQQLPGLYQDPVFWDTLAAQALEMTAVLLFPVGIVLLSSLVTQLEHRNVTWKQVHVTPQSAADIFLSKLLVLLMLIFFFLVLFNAGLFLVGALPSIAFPELRYPVQAFPLGALSRRACALFLASAPVIIGQFALGVLTRHFALALGVGLGLVIASLLAFSWEYNYLTLYGYAGIEYLREVGRRAPWTLPWSPPAVGAAVFVTAAAGTFALYARRRDRG